MNSSCSKENPQPNHFSTQHPTFSERGCVSDFDMPCTFQKTKTDLATSTQAFLASNHDSHHYGHEITDTGWQAQVPSEELIATSMKKLHLCSVSTVSAVFWCGLLHRFKLQTQA